MYIIIFIIILILTVYFLIDKGYTKWDISMVNSSSNQKVIIFSSYDENFLNKSYVQKNHQIIKRYAEKNGHLYMRFLENDISPYWLRVRNLQKLMYTNPENTIIAYFDADAIPVHENISIGSFIESLNSQEFDIFISEDPYVRYTFNTGVFIVKNTKRAREFVDKWMGMYKKSNWSKNDDKWTCNMCLYSGFNYEQGSFNKLYMGINDKTLVKTLHSEVLDGAYKSNNTFSIHLMNKTDEYRDSVLSNY